MQSASSSKFKGIGHLTIGFYNLTKRKVWLKAADFFSSRESCSGMCSTSPQRAKPCNSEQGKVSEMAAHTRHHSHCPAVCDSTATTFGANSLPAEMPSLPSWTALMASLP